MRRWVVVASLLVSGCGSNGSQTVTPTNVSSPATGGFESAQGLLIQFFVGLNEDDDQLLSLAVCDSTVDVAELRRTYQQGVRATGPIRLRVASVDPSAQEGDVPMDVTTPNATVALIAHIEAEQGGGVCVSSITSEDGSPVPVPIWIEP